MARTWISRAFTRGFILTVLMGIHEESIASVTSIVMLMAMFDRPMTHAEVLEHLAVLAQRGYVRLYTAAEFPEHFSAKRQPPSTVIGVQILPKGVAWEAGQLPVDVEVLGAECRGE